jgi:superfamily I DNA and/or RNA helicase
LFFELVKRVFNSVNEYVNYWRELILKERNYEIQSFKELIVKTSLKKREKEGLAVSNLKPKKIVAYGKILYRFGREKEIESDIKVGDSVLIYPVEFEKDKSRENIIRKGILGNIESKGLKFFDISLQKPLPIDWTKRKLVVQLFVSEITFKRMLNTIAKIKEGKSVFDINKILR